MTERQIEVLKMSVNGVHYYDDLQGHDRGVLMYLADENLVYTKALSPPIYFITEKGRAKLKALENEAKQEAESKRQQRFENKISVLNVLVPAVTFVLGLLVEHFSGLVEWVVSFFH